MSIIIRSAFPADCPALAAVEAACFPPEEAAAPESILKRLETFPESFFAAEEDGRIVGLINGCVTDLPRIEDRFLRMPPFMIPKVPTRWCFPWQWPPAVGAEGSAACCSAASSKKAGEPEGMQ